MTPQTAHLGPGDVLHGREVYLRVPRPDELAFIRMLWSDPETMAAVGGPIEFSETKAIDWFSRVVSPGNGMSCYCLIFNSEDTPVGEVSFHKWDPAKRSAHLNIKVLARHRQRGYAKDALDAFLACFFGRVAGLVMTDDVALDNPAGQRLLGSAGFTSDDSVADVCWMVITREMFVKHDVR
ncbi:MAG: GNAT family N-acetyltransferase [Phycisphaerae bacterium]|jgi:RimJ/RimL family protein N-acetyltransferase|nr:GNAT family N-acetyltransferase [Phycisphaerae bacterium]